MFGLRKRALQEDAGYGWTKKVKLYNYRIAPGQKSTCCFDMLPVEIIYIIFESLSTKDIMTLRLVNRRFKLIVDQHKLTWTRNIFLNLDLDRKLVYSSLLSNFVHSIVDLPDISFKCERRLTKDESHKINMFSFDSLPNDYLNCVSVFAQSLNVISLESLNLVSKIARRLVIEKFITNSGQLIDSKRMRKYSDKDYIHVFEQVICLTVNCTLHETDRNKGYLWPNILAENVLLGRVDEYFPRLRHLHLIDYSGPVHELFVQLTRIKSLQLLELTNCWSKSTPVVDKFPKSSRLRLDTFRITGAKSLNMIVRNYLHLKSIINIGVNFNRSDKSYLKTNSDEFVQCIVYLTGKLTQLQCFTTNMLHVDNISLPIWHKINLKELLLRTSKLNLTDRFVESHNCLYCPNRFNDTNVRIMRLSKNAFDTLFNVGVDNRPAHLISKSNAYLRQLIEYESSETQHVTTRLFAYLSRLDVQTFANREILIGVDGIEYILFKFENNVQSNISITQMYISV